MTWQTSVVGGQERRLVPLEQERQAVPRGRQRPCHRLPQSQTRPQDLRLRSPIHAGYKDGVEAIMQQGLKARLLLFPLIVLACRMGHIHLQMTAMHTALAMCWKQGSIAQYQAIGRPQARMKCETTRNLILQYTLRSLLTMQTMAMSWALNALSQTMEPVCAMWIYTGAMMISMPPPAQ